MRAMPSSGGGVMKIGEVAERSGFSIRTLRFYERRGLVSPARRGPGGYRLYGETELDRLTFIRQAKALGLTLAAIHELVLTAGRRNRNGTRAHLLRLLGTRIAQTTDQIGALTALRDELQRRRRTVARRAGRRTEGPCTCLETLPRRP
jgi:DNA-binding transcriptional MerR regulator